MDSVRRALRRRRAFAQADHGAAVVEFIGISLVLLVPLTYLIVTLGRVQAGAFAAESAARDAARAAAVTGVAQREQGQSAGVAVEVAVARGSGAAGVVVDDFGFDPHGDATVDFSCSSSPCFEPGGTVGADVTIVVALPGIPGFVSAVMPLEVPVSASARSPIDGLAEQP
jgi:Flp pilus assembly protein TadG